MSTSQQQKLFKANNHNTSKKKFSSRFVMSTVSTASTAMSLWTPLKHISKTKFHIVNSVTSVNSSKSLNSFKAYFKNKISVLSTMSTASYSKRLEKKMWFLLIFDIISVNSVNSINSNKYLIIFEAYFKNKISMLSPVSTTAISLWTSLKHISKTRCMWCQQCQQQRNGDKNIIFPNFLWSTVSTLSTAVSLWTFFKHISKTRFPCCQQCQQHQQQ